MRRFVTPVVSMLFVLLFLHAEEGRTSAFNVSPLKIVLSGKSSSALLEITNQSETPLRLQLSVSSWNQSPLGEIVLSATDEVLLFPPLLTVEPGEKRKVRLGAVTPRDHVEKSFRIVLEELPPLADSSAETGGRIRVLTRMTIPVFLEPSKPVFEGQITDLSIRDATLSFEIRNAGTTHFFVQQIHVAGMDASGQPLLTRTIEGWYILAGGTRRYGLPIPNDDCRGLRTLSIEALTDGGPLKSHMNLPAGWCVR